MALLTRLAGVGPATASAVLATAAPAVYAFFDEVVATQIPGLGPVAFSSGYYQRYAEALAATRRRPGRSLPSPRLARARPGFGSVGVGGREVATEALTPARLLPAQRVEAAYRQQHRPRNRYVAADP